MNTHSVVNSTRVRSTAFVKINDFPSEVDAFEAVEFIIFLLFVQLVSNQTLEHELYSLNKKPRASRLNRRVCSCLPTVVVAGIDTVFNTLLI